MFSGQGSHYYQMGRDLYEQHEVFRDVMNTGDCILRTLLHRSVIEEIFQNPISKEFDDLLISHPSLLLVEYALYRMLESEGIRPDYVWGSSAGEFSAAVASGIIDFETALQLVVRQANLTAQLCPKGRMLAVLENPELYQRSDVLQNLTTLAGINFPKNFVLSCSLDALEEVLKYLHANDIIFQKLPVSYAFHSPEIAALKVPFVEFCATLAPFNLPGIPFLSSAKAQRLDGIDHEYFWQVARQPIRFHQTFLNFPYKDHGIFIDCGPSGSLSTAIKYSLPTLSRTSFFPLLTPYRRAKQNLEDIKKCLMAD